MKKQEKTFKNSEDDGMKKQEKILKIVKIIEMKNLKFKKNNS